MIDTPEKSREFLIAVGVIKPPKKKKTRRQIKK